MLIDWFEWTLEDSNLVKALVVEVEFNTYPNSSEFRRNVLDAIEETTWSRNHDGRE